MQSIIFVHPTLSVDFMFAQCRLYNYKIVSIVTDLEKNNIDLEYITKYSDYVIKGSEDPEKDFDKIQAVIHNHQLNIKAVINGIDSAIYYTDFLQQKMIDSSVNSSAAKTRLNKYLVNQKIMQKNVGIPSIELTKNEDLQEKFLLEFIEAIGFPIIAKPSEDTAAMAAFSIINEMYDLQCYLKKYLNKQNTYYQDKPIKKVILQKYISAENFDEFALDFVSYQGKHYCRGIIDYTKTSENGNYKIDRYCKPLTLHEVPNIIPVIEYVANCLTDLEVQYGCTHNEVFWDRKDTFYLIESNNRMAGNGIIEIYNYAYGHNPLKDYFDLLNQQTLTNFPVQRKSYSLTLDLYNKSTPKANWINVQDLSSFAKLIHFRKKEQLAEDFYKNYTRADHINASVLLNHESPEQLQQDINTIFSRENSGDLFKI